MALTLVTNPVGTATKKIFAGFQSVEFIFKREDLEITSVESGSGGLQINVETDLTDLLEVGDSIYVYAAGEDHTYSDIGTILSLTSTDITTDIAFVQAATGGYINYLKNYYVEMQCVDPNFSTSNLLSFSLTSDGDSAGNISIDVSIVNDLNRQRGDIEDGFISESTQEFEVKYREVYDDSSNSFTLIDDQLIVLSYATETPESEVILNQFDTPKIYLGYPAAVVISKEADSASSTLTMNYKELDINGNELNSDSLSELDSDKNGFLMWAISADLDVLDATEYLQFETTGASEFDFASTDFESTDFLTE